MCFGAKDNSFGTFEIRQSGDMYNLKLVHQSGAVNCINDINSATKWGCGASNHNNELYVHITNESSAYIFPPNSSVNFDDYLFYTSVFIKILQRLCLTFSPSLCL